jgi:transposase
MFKQIPIDKNLIKNSKLFIPYYTNEKYWNKLNFSSWFDGIVYNYNVSNEYKNICSIDIGAANFISLYSPSGVCYKVKTNKYKLDNVLKNKDLTPENKEKKIKNLIYDLHIKTANLIYNNFDIIYIGQIFSVDCTNFQKIDTIEDNLVKILCHNEFLNILKIHAKKKNKKLYIVDESFTSKTCTKCGELNKFDRIQFGDDSDRRQFICKYCNVIVCRDIAAARCILIKNSNL